MTPSEARQLDAEVADRIYDILVAECGARDDEDARRQFCGFAGDPKRSDCWASRFDGGLGGVFWHDPDSWYVTGHPKLDTADRLAAIDRANARLAELRAAISTRPPA